jgi:hypothetical protein
MRTATVLAHFYMNGNGKMENGFEGLGACALLHAE